MSKTSTVYLIHFAERYKHAQHYMGSTSYLEARLEHHRTGNGSRLMAAVSAAGIPWEVVRTWKGDKNVERNLKNRGSRARLCPICSPNNQRGPHE